MRLKLSARAHISYGSNPPLAPHSENDATFRAAHSRWWGCCAGTRYLRHSLYARSPQYAAEIIRHLQGYCSFRPPWRGAYTVKHHLLRWAAVQHVIVCTGSIPTQSSRMSRFSHALYPSGEVGRCLRKVAGPMEKPDNFFDSTPICHGTESRVPSNNGTHQQNYVSSIMWSRHSLSDADAIFSFLSLP